MMPNGGHFDNIDRRYSSRRSRHSICYRGSLPNLTIPANTKQAVFDSQSQAGPLAFQTGTVAGNHVCRNVDRRAESEELLSLGVGRCRPEDSETGAGCIDSIETSNQSGLVVSITLSSTPREVTLTHALTFKTNPRVSLSCAALSGCSAFGHADSRRPEIFHGMVHITYCLRQAQRAPRSVEYCGDKF